MYVVKVEVRETAEGAKGTFATADIPKGSAVWQFKPDYDTTISPKDYNQLNETQKEIAQNLSLISPKTFLVILPPEDDPMVYTRQSKDSNLSPTFDKNVSGEIYFTAKNDIKNGEELTWNRSDFNKFLPKGRSVSNLLTS